MQWESVEGVKDLCSFGQEGLTRLGAQIRLLLPDPTLQLWELVHRGRQKRRSNLKRADEVHDGASIDMAVSEGLRVAANPFSEAQEF